ncbi:MAG: GxxExxY protein [Bacteroidetes bacterium]|nr:GxxExxY protein [Bacteroidota bacterium]
MRTNDITGKIIDIAFSIHKGLGPGLLESVYEKIMFEELLQSGLDVERQKPYPIFWNQKKIDLGFRADLVVENKVIVELKSVEALAKVHFKQLQTYLKIANIKTGLLINFNEALLKTGLRRVINKHYV